MESINLIGLIHKEMTNLYIAWGIITMPFVFLCPFLLGKWFVDKTTIKVSKRIGLTLAWLFVGIYVFSFTNSLIGETKDKFFYLLSSAPIVFSASVDIKKYGGDVVNDFLSFIQKR